MIIKILSIKRFLRFIIVGFTFIILGCGGGPYNLTLNNFPIKSLNSNYQENCNVKVNPIIDERHLGNHLGNFGTSEVYANDSLIWIEKSLSTLQTNNSQQIEQIILNSAINKFYITTIHSQRVANVVLRVNFIKGELERTKLYRGSDISTIWFGTENEVIESFSDALQIVIVNIKKDIEKLCSKNTLSFSTQQKVG